VFYRLDHHAASGSTVASLSPDIDLFAKYVRRQYLAMRVIGVVFLAIGLVPVWYAIWMASAVERPAALFVAALFAVPGISIAALARRFASDRHRGLKLLRESPEQVIWIWPTRKLMNGAHVQTHYALCTRSGDKPMVWVRAWEEAAAATLLGQRCPRALLGYDPEWEAAYRKDPKTFDPRPQGG